MNIGITTTIPIEIVYAAGHVPVDLNNSFMAADDRAALVQEAEVAGFPANFCAWIKGIYGLIKTGAADVDAVIAVMQGDCSNTQALAEAFQADGVEVIPFSFPFDRDPAQMTLQLQKLRERLGATAKACEEMLGELDGIRAIVYNLDDLTWRGDRVTGLENHLAQVSCSDMAGNPPAFGRLMRQQLDDAQQREPLGEKVRLGYIGVPPIAPELYDFLETLQSRVVYNEVQRQFTLPGAAPDLTGRYLEYTYPYSVFGRIEDIRREIERRAIHGLIHYVQSFCFRQVEDMIIRRYLNVPVLAVEMDQATRLDGRTRTRLETFVDLLRDRVGKR
jgi:benzoyl-CoA reductase/2-hydroxyglutaryl-CoA dehydratase subunit BcrC/BadD/HgdB